MGQHETDSRQLDLGGDRKRGSPSFVVAVPPYCRHPRDSSKLAQQRSGADIARMEDMVHAGKQPAHLWVQLSVSVRDHAYGTRRFSHDPSCSPSTPGICTTCPRRPATNAFKMIAQMRQYLVDTVQLQYLFSYFTIKTKLKASYIDDGRPTEIALLYERPRFYCLFAGKVNSIYEIERML